MARVNSCGADPALSVPQELLLVFINPCSGTKVAQKMFDRQVGPQLKDLGVEHQVTVTQYPGHATEVINRYLTARGDQDQEGHLKVVVVSGDGLLHEIVNALHAADPDILKRTTFGLIPGGSGNALNCSLLHDLGQSLKCPYGLGSEASFQNVVHGVKDDTRMGLDLMEVELASANETQSRKILSFLGCTIGVVADADIGSESIRFLGYLRAYLAVACWMLVPKEYHATVSYLPLQTDPGTVDPIPVKCGEAPLKLPSFDQPVPSYWTTETGSYYMIYLINCAKLDPLTLLAPKSKLEDGVLWLVLFDTSFRRSSMIKWFLNCGTGCHVAMEGCRVLPVQAFRVESIRPSGYLSIDAESYEFGSFQGQILRSMTNLFVSKRPKN